MGNVLEKIFLPNKEENIKEVWSKDPCISKEHDHIPVSTDLDTGNNGIFIDLTSIDDEFDQPNSIEKVLEDQFVELDKPKGFLSVAEDVIVLSEDSSSGKENARSSFKVGSKRTRKFLPRKAKIHKVGMYAEFSLYSGPSKKSKRDDAEQGYEATLDLDEDRISSSRSSSTVIYDAPSNHAKTYDDGRKEYSIFSKLVTNENDLVELKLDYDRGISNSFSSHSSKISVGSCGIDEENIGLSSSRMMRSGKTRGELCFTLENKEKKSMEKLQSVRIKPPVNNNASEGGECQSQRDTMAVKEGKHSIMYMQDDIKSNQGQRKLKRSLVHPKQNISVTTKPKYTCGKEERKHSLLHRQSCGRKLSLQRQGTKTNQKKLKRAILNPEDLNCAKRPRYTHGKDQKEELNKPKTNQRKLKRAIQRKKKLYVTKKLRHSSRMDGKKEFYDLFERILRNTDELRRNGITPPLQIPKENGLTQIKWDPIIFHKNKVVEEYPSNEDDPLKSLWEDMEEAARKMDVDEREESSCKTNCKHVLVLHEDEGYACIHCGLVTLSIEKVFPPLEYKMHHYNNRNGPERDLYTLKDDNGCPAIAWNPVNCNINSAWSQIEELKDKMRDHQKDGFEFLWKNIGASFKRDGNHIGGCILAHPPGTGKSLLIISFLKSFMHLNSWSRALIVAPKNMLLPWQNEFGKWNANINVHLLRSVKAKPSLEYLKIISEWHHTTSVLIITYGLFAKLTDERTAAKKLEYHNIGKLLLYIPDLLVMDEGHVPRRNYSKLRKSISRVRTWGRILVSGTLFQNNVHELFNSLYLARPNFLYGLDVPYLNERLVGLDKENIKQWQRFEEFQVERTKAEEETEARSRKLFLEEIGSKLDKSNEEEFRSGIKKYRSITASFVHSYDGAILNMLPGLKESVVLLQATRLQENILNEVKKKLQLQTLISEYLDTLINIHPSLLLQVRIPRDSLSIDDGKLQEMRKDPTGGGKVQFILDMAYHCQSTKEKLLVFSQYIAPLKLVKELLEEKFKVFFITGKSLMLERQEIMESFNGAKEGTHILLASLTACGEGINLTGASRVIFLDMHWNPSRMKQASSRAFRIGQKNIVYTYWLIASGEKEANKYTRIEKKASLSRSIVASKTHECVCKQENSNAPNVIGEDVILHQLMKNNDMKIIDVIQRSTLEEEDNLSALLRQ